MSSPSNSPFRFSTPCRWALCVISLAAVFGGVKALASTPEAGNTPPATLEESESVFTLSNGRITARVDKRTGRMVSLLWKGCEMLSTGGGYWSWVGRASQPGAERTASVRIDPATNGGERAEVSCRFSYDGRTDSLPLDVDYRYSVARGEDGVFVYAVCSHAKDASALDLAEARFALKLAPEVFDYLTIDERRHRKMPTGREWDAGEPLQLKEARRIRTGSAAGTAEHKYDYSAVLAETPAYGWSSTQHGVGLWMINPSQEYIGGGPTKVELTGHLDVNPGGRPTLLNMWLGSHYGGTSLSVAKDEAWTKVIGPFVVYCNAAPTPEAQWKDALSRAAAEASAWPYAWVKEPAYPQRDERGTVSGTIVLEGSSSSSPFHVGLSAPDYRSNSRRGGIVDWQRDAKFYQFWTRADAEGHFTIRNIRPGTYTLHAFVDGVLGEFAKTDITVGNGATLDLGSLTWTPVSYGRPLWQIGEADRTAAEFRHGDAYWQWGLPFKYAEEFPHDVHFVIGKSDPRRDWNYAQPGRAGADGRMGPSTWSIAFDLPETPRGTAILRLAIAGNRSPNGVEVFVNDQPAGGTGPMPDTGVMHRDGIRGYWFERPVRFDAALLRKGTNVIQLRVAARNWVDGVLYDCVRLELDEPR